MNGRDAPLARIASSLGLVALGLVMSCGPSVIEGDGSGNGEGSGASDGTSSEGELETGAPAAWPEEAYGRYYLEAELPLGVPGMYIAFLTNLELRPDGMVATHLSCRGEAQDLEERFSVDYEGAEAHVRPQDGESVVMWRGGPLAAEVILRPGADCNTLRLELVDRDPTASGYPQEWLWHRGALVVTDTCDGISDDEWAVDLRPDVPTDCGSGG